MNRKTLLIIAMLSFLICFIFAFLLGINFDSRFELGYRMAFDDIKKSLREGHQDGITFTIKGLDGIVFYPRKSNRIEFNYKLIEKEI